MGMTDSFSLNKSEPPWLTVASSQIGIREFKDGKSNPEVEKYFAATDIDKAYHDDATPWCSAAICWCVEQAGFVSPHSAMARSWQRWGVELRQPRRGCVAVFWRGEPSSKFGHVGLYMGENKTHIFVLGGNQNDGFCLALYSRDRLISYRWPKEIKKSKTVAYTGASVASVVAFVLGFDVAEVKQFVEQAGALSGFALVAFVLSNVGVIYERVKKITRSGV